MFTRFSAQKLKKRVDKRTYFICVPREKLARLFSQSTKDGCQPLWNCTYALAGKLLGTSVMPFFSVVQEGLLSMSLLQIPALSPRVTSISQYKYVPISYR